MTPLQARIDREIALLRTVTPVGPNKHAVQETVGLVIDALREDWNLEEVQAGVFGEDLATPNNQAAVVEALKWREDTHDIVKAPSESRFAPLLKLNQK